MCSTGAVQLLLLQRGLADAGDTTSTWADLRASISGVLSAGLAGIPFAGTLRLILSSDCLDSAHTHVPASPRSQPFVHAPMKQLQTSGPWIQPEWAQHGK